MSNVFSGTQRKFWSMDLLSKGTVWILPMKIPGRIDHFEWGQFCLLKPITECLPALVFLPWMGIPDTYCNCQTSQVKKRERSLLSPATPGGNSCIACFVQSGGSSQWFRNIYAYGKAEVTFSQSIPLSRIRYLILKMFSAN